MTEQAERRLVWLDVTGAVCCALAVQVMLTLRGDYWVWGSRWLVLAVALTPLLLAFRRIDPVLVLVGLTAGAYGLSLLVPDIPWPFLAGFLLTVWRLPAQLGPRATVALGAVVGALPLVADRWRSNQVFVVYSNIHQERTHPDGSVETEAGIRPERFDRVHEAGWPVWLSVAVVVVAIAAVVVARRRGVVPVRPAAGQRLDEALEFVRRPRHALPVDLVLATVASAVIVIGLWVDIDKGGNWWTAPGWMPSAIAGSALTLAVRRLRPEVPVVVLALASLVTYWQTEESLAVLPAFALALLSLGHVRRVRWSVPIAVIVLAAVPGVAALIRYPQLVLVFPEIRNQQLVDWNSEGEFDGRQHNTVYEEMVDRQWPVTLSLALLLATAAGIALRLYWGNREVAAREAELERVRVEQEAAQVVLTERATIARDLHDVVAHAVNLMVIQAETGPDLVARGERDTLAGFQRIGDAGRRALGELDRLLSALRDPAGVPDPQLTPQPGLADVRRLVTDVADDRLEIELGLTGDPDQPPEGQQLTAYRVIQEALTNVVRHGGATKVTVTVEIGEAGVRVEVADDGVGFDPETAGRDGRHGLAGMRERVRVHGGTLELRSAPGAGATITAFLPAVTG